MPIRVMVTPGIRLAFNQACIISCYKQKKYYRSYFMTSQKDHIYSVLFWISTLYYYGNWTLIYVYQPPIIQSWDTFLAGWRSIHTLNPISIRWDLYSLQNPPRIVNQYLCLFTYSINYSQKWSTTNRIQIEWKKYSSPCRCKRVASLGTCMVGFSNQTTCLTLWRTGNLSGFTVVSCPVTLAIDGEYFTLLKKDKWIFKQQ